MLSGGTDPCGTILEVVLFIEKTLVIFAVVYAKAAELIETPLLREQTCGPKTPCIRWGSRADKSISPP